MPRQNEKRWLTNCGMVAWGVQGEREATEARFEPLTDKYRTLERFEVAVTDGETGMLERLPGEWAEFQQILTDTEAELEKAKENFRDKLTKMVSLSSTFASALP